MPNFPDDERQLAEQITIRRIVLEWNTWQLQQHVTNELLNSDFEVACDLTFDTMIFQFKRDILTDTFARDTYQAHLNIPETWWQHWKFDHAEAWFMPMWWIARYPVRYRTETATIEVKRMHSYPEATFERDPSQFGRAFIVETVDPPTWLNRRKFNQGGPVT
jgi:hypothetical protein